MDYVIKTIDTLRIERACAKRRGSCERDCEACDLYLPTEDVVKAFNTAIALLDAQHNIDELLKG